MTPSPTPPSAGTPTSTPTPVGSPIPPRPKPKPAFVTVVQRPSPNIGARRGQVLSYTIVATNRGHGEAKNTTIELPFDSAAVSVLDAQFSRPGAWVSALLTDSLVIQTGPLEPEGDVVTTTVRLLVLTTAPESTQLGARLSYTWYDHRSGGTGRSNLPIVTQAGETIAQPLYPLMVRWAADTTISASSPIFAPGEPVAFWYHTPSGAVEAAGRVTADRDGVARLDFKIVGGAAGSYSVVAYGLWTQSTAVGSLLTQSNTYNLIHLPSAPPAAATAAPPRSNADMMGRTAAAGLALRRW